MSNYLHLFYGQLTDVKDKADKYLLNRYFNAIHLGDTCVGVCGYLNEFFLDSHYLCMSQIGAMQELFKESLSGTNVL